MPEISSLHQHIGGGGEKQQLNKFKCNCDALGKYMQPDMKAVLSLGTQTDQSQLTPLAAIQLHQHSIHCISGEVLAFRGHLRIQEHLLPCPTVSPMLACWVCLDLCQLYSWQKSAWICSHKLGDYIWEGG